MPSPGWFLVLMLAAGIWAVLGFAGAAGDTSTMGPVLDAMSSVTSDAGSIKTSLLTILGVIVTVGIAWVIVRAIRQ